MKRAKKLNRGSTDKNKRLGKKYLNGNGDSRYARKRKWCISNGVWGFEVEEPKPWK